MAQLRVESGSDSRPHPLESTEVTIGRLAENDVQLLELGVSRHHARLVRNSVRDSWMLEDLGGANGTFLNGRRIPPHARQQLSDGDQITCGNVDLFFEDRSPEDKPDTGTDSEPSIVAAIQVPGHHASGLGSGEEFGATAIRSAPREEHPAERTLRVIQEVSERIVRTMDPDELAPQILESAIEHLRASRGIICRRAPNDTFAPLATHGMAESHVSKSILRRLLNEKSGFILEVGDGDELQSLKRLSISTAICVPLWTFDSIIGFISLDRVDDRRPFTNDDLQLLIAMGHQAAIALERARLAEVAAREREINANLTKYFDKQVIAEIAQSPGDATSLAPVERDITVLFSDIVSFTRMSEKLSPSALADFMRKYLTIMTEIVFSNGGTIDKYIGDAVMALFGAPRQSPDAAGNAIRAALEMKEEASKLSLPDSDRTLRVRFGISSGPVVVGNVGSAQRVEYTALGDTVNVASRLETFARPMEICIDEDTLAAVKEDEFTVQQIGDIDVKNRIEPVNIYKVLG